MKAIRFWILIGLATAFLDALPPNASAQANPLLPVVSIYATFAETREPTPLTRVRPAEFTLRRTGSTNQDLLVSISYGGTATWGADYDAPRYVSIPAGVGESVIDIVAIDDDLPESDETVIATLIAPVAGTVPSYAVDPAHPQATVIIHDGDADGRPVVSIRGSTDVLEYCPIDGDCFSLRYILRRTGPLDVPLTVFLRTSGTATADQDYPALPDTVTFGANEETAQIQFAPIDDRLYEGDETLVVTVAAGLDYLPDPNLRAVTTVIRDNEIPLSTVRISADDAWKTAEPCPVCFVVPAELSITRTGPTTKPLSVFLSYDGTATAGVDYRALPLVVTIPAGTNAARLLVLGIDDLSVEGPEVVRARLLPIVTPGGYRLDEYANEGLVVIGDGEPGAPSIRLDLIEPRAGARFVGEAPIEISALAVWVNGEVDQPVEFLADEKVIGYSEPPIVDRVPMPGWPSVHTFLWKDAPVGEHQLTARYGETSGLAVTSPPVRINVGGKNNALPTIAILRPPAVTLPADQPVEIVVEARDPDGYVPEVRFFADGRQIGEVNVQFLVEPPPGQFQEFSFVWNDASLGKHALTAQATDNRGGPSTSPPVLIEIGSVEPLPTVTVSARDAWAVEPSANAAVNPASFRILRSGPTNQPLVVTFSLGGTAENGTDYGALGRSVTLPAGRRSASIEILPVADTTREGLETVILRLQPANVASSYIIGRPSSAIVLISDRPVAVAKSAAAALPGGLVHLWFEARTDQNFRLEVSTDLQTWVTIDDVLCGEDTWHFIDDEVNLYPRRFFRLTPEPVVAPE